MRLNLADDRSNQASAIGNPVWNTAIQLAIPGISGSCRIFVSTVRLAQKNSPASLKWECGRQILKKCPLHRANLCYPALWLSWT